MLYNYFNFPASPSIAQQSHHRAARPKEFNTGDESEDEMTKKLREAGLVESDDSGEDNDFVEDEGEYEDIDDDDDDDDDE